MSKSTDTKDKSNLLGKAFKALKEAFTPEEITELNTHLNPPVAAPVVAAEAPKEFKTKEGVSVFITGADADGNIVPTTSKAFSDAAGTTPVLDGEYVFDNGTSITVAAGIVTEVENAAAVSTETADPMAEMAVQMSAQKDAFELKLAAQKTWFEKEIADLKEANKVAFKTIDKILNTPIVTTNLSAERVEKPVSEMNNYELLRYNRGEKIYK